jgi:hypothetical protein
MFLLRCFSLSTYLLEIWLKFNFYMFCKLRLYYSTLWCKIFYIKCCNNSFVDPVWVVKRGWFGFPRGHYNRTDQIIRAQVQKQAPEMLKFLNLSPYNLGSQLKSRRISNQLTYNQDRIIQHNISHVTFHKYWIKSFTTTRSRNYYKPSL